MPPAQKRQRKKPITGRPPKPPGEKYLPVSTRIRPEVAQYLAEIGNGSISGGARIVLNRAWEEQRPAK